MMRPYRRLSAVLALLVIALLVNLSWIQVLDADGIRQREGNTRLLLAQYNRMRGPILVDAAPIASSSRVAGDNLFQRSYTEGAVYATVTGYYSLLYGATGIERIENDVLSGNDPRLFVDRVQQLFAGRRQSGGAVSLTLDAGTQRAAYAALGNRRAALAVIDVNTGALLGLLSTPSFDPQVLAPNDPRRVRTEYQRLSADAGQPLRNRVLEARYAPGSVFGLVTLASALATDRFTVDSIVPAPARYTAPGTRVTVVTRDRRACSSSGRLTLAAALATQCATSLAWLGNAVGPDDLRNIAEQLGFDVDLAIPLQVQASVFTSGDAARVGTGTDVRTSVVQLAMLAATVANRGTTMRPYLVQDVRGPDLAVLDRTSPSALGTPMSTQTAAALTRIMRGSAARCPKCRVPGLTVRAVISSRTDGADTVVIASAGRSAVAVVLEATKDLASDEATAIATAMAALTASNDTV